jgi:hypothetical protein
MSSVVGAFVRHRCASASETTSPKQSWRCLPANRGGRGQDLLNYEQDQVLFVSLGPSANDASLIIDAMGLPYEVRSRVTII